MALPDNVLPISRQELVELAREKDGSGNFFTPDSLRDILDGKLYKAGTDPNTGDDIILKVGPVYGCFAGPYNVIDPAIIHSPYYIILDNTGLPLNRYRIAAVAMNVNSQLLYNGGAYFSNFNQFTFADGSAIPSNYNHDFEIPIQYLPTNSLGQYLSIIVYPSGTTAGRTAFLDKVGRYPHMPYWDTEVNDLFVYMGLDGNGDDLWEPISSSQATTDGITVLGNGMVSDTIRLKPPAITAPVTFDEPLVLEHQYRGYGNNYTNQWEWVNYNEIIENVRINLQNKISAVETDLSDLTTVVDDLSDEVDTKIDKLPTTAAGRGVIVAADGNLTLKPLLSETYEVDSKEYYNSLPSAYISMAGTNMVLSSPIPPALERIIYKAMPGAVPAVQRVNYTGRGIISVPITAAWADALPTPGLITAGYPIPLFNFNLEYQMYLLNGSIKDLWQDDFWSLQTTTSPTTPPSVLEAVYMGPGMLVKQNNTLLTPFLTFIVDFNVSGSKE